MLAAPPRPIELLMALYVSVGVSDPQLRTGRN